MLLTYTCCFCLHDDEVLMLFRHHPPSQFRWNGLGGKIEPGESPLRGMIREVAEEVGIDLATAAEVRFAGIVTWSENETAPGTGMYTYIATMREDDVCWSGSRLTAEGVLAWGPISWVCSPDNVAVVENIPRFLPEMLKSPAPAQYHCHYSGNELLAVDVRPLTDECIPTAQI